MTVSSKYDPMGASYAFSPIGWQGLTCGGGNTENCRHTTSLKYKLTVGQARVAAIWQFGGYGQNNASNGAYQVGVGGDIPPLGQRRPLLRRNLQLGERFRSDHGFGRED
jgi:hypothetical protein